MLKSGNWKPVGGDSPTGLMNISQRATAQPVEPGWPAPT